ncbi:hypothetical protein FVEG_16547 [Fusarium verticillioides 7600]|uniref:Uncharacterized protein n=1 Tax=Gibberella moniliformis (strain M3125 / FGSC 7600) TaxID=334819 RepID=W7MEB9_GIBM7|nr:hypothetical protein FVEG_16547 [Fusarium verticillioides 7600]EWG49903.1 hypothetical protein FVEG_16547 [Fusarium verticillioides 7600]
MTLNSGFMAEDKKWIKVLSGTASQDGSCRTIMDFVLPDCQLRQDPISTSISWAFASCTSMVPAMQHSL